MITQLSTPVIQIPAIQVRLPLPPALSPFARKTTVYTYLWTLVFCISVWLEPVSNLLFLPFLMIGLVALVSSAVPLRLRSTMSLGYVVLAGSLLGTFIGNAQSEALISGPTDKLFFAAAVLFFVQYARLRWSYTASWASPTTRDTAGQNIALWARSAGLATLIVMIPKLLVLFVHFQTPNSLLLVISGLILLALPYLSCLSLQENWPQTALPDSKPKLSCIIWRFFREDLSREQTVLAFKAWFQAVRYWEETDLRSSWACAGAAITGIDSPAAGVSKPMLNKLVGSSKLTLTDIVFLFCAGGIAGGIGFGNILLLSQGVTVDLARILMTPGIVSFPSETEALVYSMMLTLAHISYYMSLFYMGTAALALRNGNYSNTRNKFLIACTLALTPALVGLLFYLAPKLATYIH